MAASEGKFAEDGKSSDSKREDDSKSFEFAAKYFASSNAVFDALTDPRDVMRYTMAPATGKPEEGADWSWMDGAVHGTYLTLKRGEKIVMTWRFRDWAEGAASTVTIDLEASGADACILKMKQVGIPVKDKHGNGNVEVTVANGWNNYIFSGIKERLGFGMDKL